MGLVFFIMVFIAPVLVNFGHSLSLFSFSVPDHKHIGQPDYNQDEPNYVPWGCKEAQDSEYCRGEQKEEQLNPYISSFVKLKSQNFGIFTSVKAPDLVAQMTKVIIIVIAKVEAPKRPPTMSSVEPLAPEATIAVITSVAPLEKASKVAPARASVSLIYSETLAIATERKKLQTYSRVLMITKIIRT
jgi:hypothetical protein